MKKSWRREPPKVRLGLDPDPEPEPQPQRV
jgi:hypothetical protein